MYNIPPSPPHLMVLYFRKIIIRMRCAFFCLYVLGCNTIVSIWLIKTTVDKPPKSLYTEKWRYVGFRTTTQFSYLERKREMLYLLGVVTFLFMAKYDHYSLSQNKGKKILYGLLGFGGLFGVSFLLFLFPSPTPMLLTGKVAGGVMTLLFGCLLVYSLFIEIPFQSTYLNKVPNRHAVMTGTYALCRHPGVLWLMFLYLGLYLVTGNTKFAVAMFIFTIANVLYVLYQERVIFPRLFVNYHLYQQSTPFLLPTKKSMKRAWHTLYKH